MPENKMTNKRVTLGLSGGVDSLVTAILLKQQGYEICGVHLRLYDDTPGMMHEKNKLISTLVNKLGIEYHVRDISGLFESKIKKYIISEHEKGRTPSACAVCNPDVKLHSLLQIADELKCQFIATGHYIRILKFGSHFFIYQARDKIKDQSYFLWKVKENVLSKWLTPLGNLTKHEVRRIAREQHFMHAAGAKESMGLCFLRNQRYHSFLKSNLHPDFLKEGPVVNNRGKIIGKHFGIALYTTGQKKRLQLYDNQIKYAVKSINIENNTIIADQRENLYRKRFTISKRHFIDNNDLKRRNIQVKVRGVGKNPEGFAQLKALNNEKVNIQLEYPAWAIAPGQPVVCYVSDRLIGGGFIDRIY